MNKDQLILKLKNLNFSKSIVEAFKRVKRENFLPEHHNYLAYEDIALPLEQEATLSQPYTIAFMLDLLELKKDQKILEIVSGSGYVLALISKIINSGRIYGVEIIKSLAKKSSQLLKKNKIIKIFRGNGINGLLKYAPFDRILISAESENIPEYLYSQLKDQGILVCPVKNSIFQIKKYSNRIIKKEFPGFVFIKLKKK